jgi:hypothetical protein
MAARPGKNGLIYISGTEITGANSWTLRVETATAETPQFGDSWTKQTVGLNSWSGSVSAWDESDSSTLQDAATAGVAVAVLLYPLRSDLTDYYSGNAIFSFGSEVNTGSAIGNTADFVGDGTLTITGFD